jgi:hypothetical protein
MKSRLPHFPICAANPLGSSLRSQRSGERRLSRHSFSDGGRFSPCDINAASFDSADGENNPWPQRLINHKWFLGWHTQPELSNLPGALKL